MAVVLAGKRFRSSCGRSRFAQLSPVEVVPGVFVCKFVAFDLRVPIRSEVVDVSV